MANPYEGTKPGRPGDGKKGPNDRGGGTRHFTPPLPKPNQPRPGGTKK